MTIHPVDRARVLGLRAHPLRDDERPFYGADGFLPLAPPTASDWLAQHAEPGQSYDDFLAMPRATPTAARRRIRIVPLGEVPAMVELDLVVAYLEAFFALDVVVDEPVSLEVTSREGERGLQLHADELLQALAARVPTDTALVLGLTAVDLYPDEGWHFAYGLASYGRRVAVASTARMAPTGAAPDERRRLLHRRLLGITTHELGHALGVAHCTHYSCVMNGANHMAEVDGHPLQVCPVDLRKLDRVLDFDHPGRYRTLAALLDRLDLEADAAWLRARLDAAAAARREEAVAAEAAASP